MNRETLHDLRALLALYPYYQTARLLMLQNLYLLHDTSFDEELRRAAIYITDRKRIFEMVEAAHYQIERVREKGTANGRKLQEDGKNQDRTSDLINSFLDSLPMDTTQTDGEKKDKKRKPTLADATMDYVSYLMETEGEKQDEQGSRTISLIDNFMEDGGFKFNKLEDNEEYKPEFSPELTPSEGNEETENGGVFTETLARIYIKQGKYERAIDIIKRLQQSHPDKKGYQQDQIRFLKKLILNNQNKNKEGENK